ncbi:hypothetical protein [Microcoleus sp. B4-D4]|uniref:hypothetical protein n=1 Tax=Microcoleus sp. B4-D4 TaxID=2818667 RepID=UPI002FD45A2C
MAINFAALKEEGRRKKEEGRRKKEDAKRKEEVGGRHTQPALSRAIFDISLGGFT